MHKGGDCSNFSTFHERNDCNGDIISSWAESVSKGIFRCRVCHSGPISFARGMKSFNQHAAGKNHKDKLGKTESFTKQLSIAESFKKASKEEDEDNELKSRVKN